MPARFNRTQAPLYFRVEVFIDVKINKKTQNHN